MGVSENRKLEEELGEVASDLKFSLLFAKLTIGSDPAATLKQIIFDDEFNPMNLKAIFTNIKANFGSEIVHELDHKTIKKLTELVLNTGLDY